MDQVLLASQSYQRTTKTGKYENTTVIVKLITACFKAVICVICIVAVGGNVKVLGSIDQKALRRLPMNFVSYE